MEGPLASGSSGSSRQPGSSWLVSLLWVAGVFAAYVLMRLTFFRMFCCGHPNQNGSSVLYNPGVLYIDYSVHLSVVIMALMAILVFVLPFIALTSGRTSATASQ